MIRLGLRLTVGGGREAAARLAVIAAATALGVGLLLSTLAATNAVTTQNDRNAWLNSGGVFAGSGDASAEAGAAAGSVGSTASPQAATGTTGARVDPLWWQIGADSYKGTILGRVDVAATGPNSPVPPGIPRLPGPGEYYASPALAELLRTVPAAQLADRYPGRLIGTIGDKALPGPDSLIIMVGHRPDELAAGHQARKLTAISGLSPADCSSGCVVGTDHSGMNLILSVVAAALIFPVLILIGTATRLAATRREQRFAAMRLVGATPRQISVVSAVESTVATVAGVLVGFALYLLVRPELASVNFTGTLFFRADLALSPADVLVVALGVPVAAAVSARIALRRVQISPLGVSRRVTPRPPRAYRVIPLVGGLLELGYFIGRRPATIDGQTYAFLTGILLVLAGIVVAGPWLTMAGGRLMARGTSRPDRLVAGRRLADDPKGGFRAVSGLVLALCVTSGAVGVITSMVAERGIPGGSAAIRNTLIADYIDFDNQGRQINTVTPPPDAVLTELRAIPGVQGVLVNHEDPSYVRGPGYGGGLVTCAQLATLPSAFGTCPAGAQTAAVNSAFDIIGLQGPDAPPWPTVWPAATDSVAQLQQDTRVQEIDVATDGSTAAIERARTLLVRAYPGESPPVTIGEDRARRAQELAGFQRLADVVIGVSFPIAGCSLAVSVAGGLADRKRPFSLLRLTGVRLAVLRRIVLLESAVPLFVVAAVAIGTGFLAAALFLKAQLDYTLRAPGGDYYLMVVLGLAAGLGVIAATLPLLRRITGPEVARND
ncbi:ABC transporter permease [Kitasatospora sp. NBC_01250]|uniref:FtsX-like permease family protein n=1 Tax=Kitasatospora sp. NBC_01250 TaxID=2903571 RepID=UPI002E2F6495|nr:FtsX-like permease family protein [Kitasatospora sp. NBC_01250]